MTYSRNLFAAKKDLVAVHTPNVLNLCDKIHFIFHEAVFMGLLSVRKAYSDCRLFVSTNVTCS